MSWVVSVVKALCLTLGDMGRDRVWAICPWHQPADAPASWATTFFIRTAGTRRDAKGREYTAVGQCHCFACGRGGTIRDLVAKVLGCTEAEADAFVRKRGGTRQDSKVETVRRRVKVVSTQPRLPARFTLPRGIIFGDDLAEWVTGARAEVERRGITAEEVRRYGIGYAVDGAKLGGRIVIPWRDGYGRVGSYTARTFTGGEPKYTTPHGDDGPDRDVVFGEHLWPMPHEREVVVVTEGAFNAIAAARACAWCVGAVGGADNYTPGQAAKLATFSTILVLSDPDLAGDKLARAIAMTTGRSSIVERVRLPRGRDAEDVGPVVLSREIAQALERAGRMRHNHNEGPT